MDKFYSCEEVAARYNIKVTTVWDWVRTHKIPAIKLGKQYRITPHDLAVFEQDCRIKGGNNEKNSD